MPVHEFVVESRGVGRKDYSLMTEFSVEPTIRSYQSLYSHYDLISVPALGSIVIDVVIPLEQVVLLYDFLASIPSNNLIRMIVTAVAPDLSTGIAVDKSGYQVVEAHLLKGYIFFHIIRLTLYNYRDVEETDMRVSLTGLYTSEKEYYMSLG